MRRITRSSGTTARRETVTSIDKLSTGDQIKLRGQRAVVVNVVEAGDYSSPNGTVTRLPRTVLAAFVGKGRGAHRHIVTADDDVEVL
jgi:hypothetical protein